MQVVFTRMPGENDHRRFRSLLLSPLSSAICFLDSSQIVKQINRCKSVKGAVLSRVQKPVSDHQSFRSLSTSHDTFEPGDDTILPSRP